MDLLLGGQPTLLLEPHSLFIMFDVVSLLFSVCKAGGGADVLKAKEFTLLSNLLSLEKLIILSY